MNEMKGSTGAINKGKESATIINGVGGTVTIMNEVKNQRRSRVK